MNSEKIRRGKLRKTLSHGGRKQLGQERNRGFLTNPEMLCHVE